MQNISRFPRGRTPLKSRATESYIQQIALTLLVDMDDWKQLDDYPRFLTRFGEWLGLKEYEDKKMTPMQFYALLKVRQEVVGIFCGFPAKFAQSLLYLGDQLGLSKIEQDILGVISILLSHASLVSLADMVWGDLTHYQLVQKLSDLLNTDKAQIRKALSSKGILNRSGLMKIDLHARYSLDMKVDLLDGLMDVLFSGNQQINELLEQFFYPASRNKLTLTDFPHLKREIRLLKKVLSTSRNKRRHGANILLYGTPGSGKTELVKALAVATNLELYLIPTEDSSGKAVTGEDRLFSFYLAQSALSRRNDTLLLFDEVEDVFDRGVFMDKPKGWINRQLEVNTVTTLWVCNSIYSIDSAHIRRFDMVVQMDSPPLEIRRKIFGAQVAGLGIEKSWVDRIARHEGLSPGILSQAAQIASLSDRQSKDETEKDMEMILQGTLQAMNHLNLPRRAASDVIGFQQEYLNADADLSQLVAGLKRDPRARICLYGPPGTGKSAFGRSLADRLKKQLIIKRSSDLLGPLVGQTEDYISTMFRDSEKQSAILLLDEADSFLRDRKTAQQSWQVTQVNELLTQMEAFEGIFICCTNLIDDLDAASLRRFDLKIYFSPLNSKQSFQLFCQVLKEQGFQATLEPEWKARLSTLIDLTPGDFAVAVRQQRLRTDDLNPQRLFDALQIECKFRHGDRSKRGIGFCAVF